MNQTIITANANFINEFNPDKDNWLLWSERLQIAEEIECTEEKQKKAILLKSICAESYETLRCLCDPVLPNAKTFKELSQLLESQYSPTVIIFRERRKFLLAEKQEAESVAAWFARIKKLALNCKFGAQLDSLVLNKFVCGTSGRIFERLCEEDQTLTLADAYKKALVVEAKIESQKSDAGAVNYVKSKRHGSKSKDTNETNSTKQHCKHCGWTNHQSNSCKFKKATCHRCSKVGHLANVCRSKTKDKKINFVKDSSKSDNLPTTNISNFDFSVFSIGTCESESVQTVTDDLECASNIYILPILMDGVKLEVTCDTGAPVSLISIGLFDKFYQRKRLRQCKVPFCSYAGNKINVVGEFDAIIVYKGLEKSISFVVTNTDNPPLLGRNFLRNFGFELVQTRQVNAVDSFSTIIDSIKKDFFEVFDGALGEFKFGTVKLHCDKEAKPVFCKPRPIPLAWKPLVEKQLHDLVELKVLEPIDNSSWGTPLVPILKPTGDIRICGDYKTTINKYLSDFKYPLPRIDEIFASLQGGKLFSKLDLSNAYNQLILDEDSQMLCAWSTHIGVFKMKRLPFGVKPAAAIFQKTIETVIKGIPTVTNYMDDIVVTGKNLTEHVSNLKLVLTKLKEAGLKLNLSKCAFFQTEISYLGFNISSNGLSKNKDRYKSVIQAPVPTDLSEVRAFIGMVNQYSKFIPRYAQKMAPLYALLQKNPNFIWSKECTEAYELMKKEISSDQVLVHFDPELPMVLSTDASKDSVAGVLSHIFENGIQRPIAFVSRALCKSEKNYSTIEKEALAIIFSISKLRQYLLGSPFELHTDHKPLLAIFGENKGLPVMAAARMQRWAFILSGFQYKIKYVKGSENPADNLSRIPQFEINDSPNECSYINYSDVAKKLNFKQIAIETRRDKVLSKLIDAIHTGSVNELKDSCFAPFKNKQNELSVESGCILWGYRTVIPDKLRKELLIEVHKSHLGIVKTKALARSYFWWPKLDDDITQLIKNCHSCLLLQDSPEKSALIPWKPTDSPWKRIHIDFAGPIKGYQLFVIVDSYSKWVEVFKTKDMSTSFVISKLKELLCRFGLVKAIVSDNGRQFVSSEFRKFLSDNFITQILTAPGHPATNGQAEKFIKTLKKSIYANLKDVNPDNFDVILNRFLADYRSTKHCVTNETPAKLFLGRELVTRFSVLRPLLLWGICPSTQLP